jgi:hypothetical protein
MFFVMFIPLSVIKIRKIAFTTGRLPDVNPPCEPNSNYSINFSLIPSMAIKKPILLIKADTAVISITTSTIRNCKLDFQCYFK